MEKIINDSLIEHKKALGLLEKRSKVVKEIALLFIKTLRQNKKIIFMGNGGSAADAQHLAGELVGRFKKNRKALTAIAITTNTSVLTAIANDFGYDQIFSRQIEALARPGDLVVGISTSGKSKNIMNAIKMAKVLKLKTVGFSGKDRSPLAKSTDICLTIPLSDTPSIQEMHIFAGHMICAIVEKYFSQ